MTGTQLLVDGALVPAATATISALDRGFRSGEGLFETLRVRAGRAFRLAGHLDRLVGAAGRLDIDLDHRTLGQGIATVVAANHHLGTDVAVRITCSAGPLDVERSFPAPAGSGRAATVVMSVQAVAERADPARGLLVDLRRELSWAKSTSSLVTLVAQRRAIEQGASDALLCDPWGAPLEAATANLFVVHDGRLTTPPVEAGALDGVTRTAILDLARDCGVEPDVRPLSRELLLGADEALLTSAVRGLRPLVTVDGQRIGSGAPGPVTGQLTAAHAAAVAAESRPVDDPLSWSSDG